MLLATSQTFVSKNFALEQGGAFDELAVAYETQGSLNQAGDNAILLCHGYTSSPHAAGNESGWWHNLIGPGKAIDTSHYFVICSNMIGSAYGSTGPATVDPGTGAPHGAAFPDITTGDMVAAQSRLLDHLGVAQMAAVIGYSYGGYLTFVWGHTHPERMRALVPVATGIAGRGGKQTVTDLQNRFAAHCPGWRDGQYYGKEKESGVEDALTAIRIETLRSYGIDRSLAAQHEDPAQAKRELDNMAREWAREFDANSLITLRKAAIQYDARPQAKSIRAPLLYVLSRTDALFPPKIAASTLELLDEAGVDARYFEIDSEHGHRGPSIDWRLWAEPLRAFLDEHARRKADRD